MPVINIDLKFTSNLAQIESSLALIRKQASSIPVSFSSPSGLSVPTNSKILSNIKSSSVLSNSTPSSSSSSSIIAKSNNVSFLDTNTSSAVKSATDYTSKTVSSVNSTISSGFNKINTSKINFDQPVTSFLGRVSDNLSSSIKNNFMGSFSSLIFNIGFGLITKDLFEGINAKAVFNAQKAQTELSDSFAKSMISLYAMPLDAIQRTSQLVHSFTGARGKPLEGAVEAASYFSTFLRSLGRGTSLITKDVEDLFDVLSTEDKRFTPNAVRVMSSIGFAKYRGRLEKAAAVGVETFSEELMSVTKEVYPESAIKESPLLKASALKELTIYGLAQRFDEITPVINKIMESAKSFIDVFQSIPTMLLYLTGAGIFIKPILTSLGKSINNVGEALRGSQELIPYRSKSTSALYNEIQQGQLNLSPNALNYLQSKPTKGDIASYFTKGIINPKDLEFYQKQLTLSSYDYLGLDYNTLNRISSSKPSYLTNFKPNESSNLTSFLKNLQEAVKLEREGTVASNEFTTALKKMDVTYNQLTKDIKTLSTTKPNLQTKQLQSSYSNKLKTTLEPIITPDNTFKNKIQKHISKLSKIASNIPVLLIDLPLVFDLQAKFKDLTSGKLDSKEFNDTLIGLLQDTGMLSFTLTPVLSQMYGILTSNISKTPKNPKAAETASTLSNTLTTAALLPFETFKKQPKLKTISNKIKSPSSTKNLISTLQAPKTPKTQSKLKTIIESEPFFTPPSIFNQIQPSKTQPSKLKSYFQKATSKITSPFKTLSSFFKTSSTASKTINETSQLTLKASKQGINLKSIPNLTDQITKYSKPITQTLKNTKTTEKVLETSLDTISAASNTASAASTVSKTSSLAASLKTGLGVAAGILMGGAAALTVIYIGSELLRDQYTKWSSTLNNIASKTSPVQAERTEKVISSLTSSLKTILETTQSLTLIPTLIGSIGFGIAGGLLSSSNPYGMIAGGIAAGATAGLLGGYLAGTYIGLESISWTLDSFKTWLPKILSLTDNISSINLSEDSQLPKKLSKLSEIIDSASNIIKSISTLKDKSFEFEFGTLTGNIASWFTKLTSFKLPWTKTPDLSSFLLNITSTITDITTFLDSFDKLDTNGKLIGISKYLNTNYESKIQDLTRISELFNKISSLSESLTSISKTSDLKAKRMPNIESPYALGFGLAGAAIGTFVTPGVGTAIGGAIGYGTGFLLDWSRSKTVAEDIKDKLTSIKDFLTYIEPNSISINSLIDSIASASKNITSIDSSKLESLSKLSAIFSSLNEVSNALSTLSNMPNLNDYPIDMHNIGTFLNHIFIEQEKPNLPKYLTNRDKILENLRGIASLLSDPKTQETLPSLIDSIATNGTELVNALNEKGSNNIPKIENLRSVGVIFSSIKPLVESLNKLQDMEMKDVTTYGNKDVTKMTWNEFKNMNNNGTSLTETKTWKESIVDKFKNLSDLMTDTQLKTYLTNISNFSLDKDTSTGINNFQAVFESVGKLVTTINDSFKINIPNIKEDLKVSTINNFIETITSAITSEESKNKIKLAIDNLSSYIQNSFNQKVFFIKVQAEATTEQPNINFKSDTSTPSFQDYINQQYNNGPFNRALTYESNLINYEYLNIKTRTLPSLNYDYFNYKASDLQLSNPNDIFINSPKESSNTTEIDKIPVTDINSKKYDITINQTGYLGQEMLKQLEYALSRSISGF